mmetsp:Transcript_103710/g.329770  ORF Transcript_103710/g.329770 Transcript_103710/m.329770 type:complete len:213 (-) Transcript_103710:202-840(-)
MASIDTCRCPNLVRKPLAGSRPRPGTFRRTLRGLLPCGESGASGSNRRSMSSAFLPLIIRPRSLRRAFRSSTRNPLSSSLLRGLATATPSAAPPATCRESRTASSAGGRVSSSGSSRSASKARGCASRGAKRSCESWAVEFRFMAARFEAAAASGPCSSEMRRRAQLLKLSASWRICWTASTSSSPKRTVSTGMPSNSIFMRSLPKGCQYSR